MSSPIRKISYYCQSEIYKNFLFHKRVRLAQKCPSLRGIARRIGHKFIEIRINENELALDYVLWISFEQLEKSVQVKIRHRKGHHLKTLLIDNGCYEHIFQSFVNFWLARRGTYCYMFHANSWKCLIDLSEKKHIPKLRILMAQDCWDMDTIFKFEAEEYCFKVPYSHERLFTLIGKVKTLKLRKDTMYKIYDPKDTAAGYLFELMDPTWNADYTDFVRRREDHEGVEYERIEQQGCIRLPINNDLDFVLLQKGVFTVAIMVVGKGVKEHVIKCGPPVPDRFGDRES